MFDDEEEAFTEQVRGCDVCVCGVGVGRPRCAAEKARTSSGNMAATHAACDRVERQNVGDNMDMIAKSENIKLK